MPSGHTFDTARIPSIDPNLHTPKPKPQDSSDDYSILMEGGSKGG